MFCGESESDERKEAGSVEFGPMDFYLNVRADSISHEAILKVFKKKTGTEKEKKKGMGSKIKGMFGSSKTPDNEVRDCLVDLAAELTTKAIGHFGYHAEVNDVFADNLFVVLTVTKMHMDESKQGFCMMPEFFTALMGTCDASMHGEYNDQTGYEFPHSRCGFTLPILSEEVANLVTRFAHNEYRQNPIKLKAVAKAPADEQQYLQMEGLELEKIPKQIKEQAPRQDPRQAALAKEGKKKEVNENADGDKENDKENDVTAETAAAAG